jgi:small conductance mechanosensitive channel
MKFWQDFLDKQALEWAVWAQNFAIALVILLVGWLVACYGTYYLGQFLRRVLPNSALISFLSSLAYALILLAAVVAALSQMGVQTASLIAVLGAAGLALALALQSSLGNLASGIMILSFQLIRPGDTIELAGVRGRVSEILIFHTILYTDDGQRVLVPNGKITSEVVRQTPAGSPERKDKASGG